MRLAFTVLPLAPVLVACVSTNAAVVDPTVQYQKTCPDAVQIFSSPERVPSDYWEVALLHSKGESSWTDERGMVASQRSKAAQLGANGIVIGDTKEPNAGTKILGSLFGTGAERKGSAVAIYIPADSQRVQLACNIKHVTAPVLRGTPTPAAPERAPVSVASGPPVPVSFPSMSIPQPRPAATARPTAVLTAQPVIASVPEASTPPSLRRAAPLVTASTTKSPGRPREVLMRVPAMRIALGDLLRLRLVEEFEEVWPGLLTLSAGDAFWSSASLSYQMTRLYSAYSSSVYESDPPTLEVWDTGEKIGDYTVAGWVLTSEYSRPE